MIPITEPTHSKYHSTRHCWMEEIEYNMSLVSYLYRVSLGQRAFLYSKLLYCVEYDAIMIISPPCLTVLKHQAPNTTVSHAQRTTPLLRRLVTVLRYGTIIRPACFPSRTVRLPAVTCLHRLTAARPQYCTVPIIVQQ